MLSRYKGATFYTYWGRRVRYLVALIAIIICCAQSNLALSASSINCQAFLLPPVDIIVCKDPEVAALDAEMTEFYSKATASLNGPKRSTLVPGKIVREVKVASEPEALLAVLKNPAYHFKRIGLEAGPLSQWLFGALAEAELPVVCVETRHMQAVLKAQINKTDRNDARGIAQMMRVGLYRPVHVKTLRSQKLRMLLTQRQLLQSKAIAIENDLRGTLRNFGLKVGMVGTVKFEARIKELVENLPDLAVLRPAGTSRAVRHPAPPPAGHYSG